MLLQRYPLSLQGSDPAKPCPAFNKKLVGGHEGIFGAQAISHDAQAVQRRLVEVGALQPADEFQRVHPAYCQDF